MRNPPRRYLLEVARAVKSMQICSNTKLPGFIQALTYLRDISREYTDPKHPHNLALLEQLKLDKDIVHTFQASVAQVARALCGLGVCGELTKLLAVEYSINYPFPAGWIYIIHAISTDSEDSDALSNHLFIYQGAIDQSLAPLNGHNEKMGASIYVNVAHCPSLPEFFRLHDKGATYADPLLDILSDTTLDHFDDFQSHITTHRITRVAMISNPSTNGTFIAEAQRIKQNAAKIAAHMKPRLLLALTQIETGRSWDLTQLRQALAPHLLAEQKKETPARSPSSSTTAPTAALFSPEHISEAQIQHLRAKYQLGELTKDGLERALCRAATAGDQADIKLVLAINRRDRFGLSVTQYLQKHPEYAQTLSTYGPTCST